MVSLLQLDELTWTKSMAIFGNFKGTTQSDFSIGKNDAGSKISTGTQPSSDISNGDLYIDSSNSTLQVYNGNWVSVGSTLTDLNVDSGTLFVDSSNDTVSVGSTSSNDKLFVNGSLRLGTNPTLKFSGAYLDVQHSNGSATQLRIRDNSSGSDPIFKIYSANNTSEVFKVQGETTTFSGNATLTGVDTLRINENGTGLRMTNVGAFDNSGGDFRIFSTSNLILATDGENGTAVTFDQSTKDAVFQGNVSTKDVSITGDIAISGNITGASTDNLSEGSTNLYYTDARANSAIDAKLVGDITLGNVTSQSVNTGVVEGVVFQPITDYGSITSTANITIDYGAVNEAGTVPAIGDFEYISDIFGPTGDSYKVDGLPSAAQPGQMIYVSDETGGAVMAFSDGTNWRRITDRAVVS